jgi:hypothetical protein
VDGPVRGSGRWRAPVVVHGELELVGCADGCGGVDAAPLQVLQPELVARAALLVARIRGAGQHLQAQAVSGQCTVPTVQTTAATLGGPGSTTEWVQDSPMCGLTPAPCLQDICSPRSCHGVQIHAMFTTCASAVPFFAGETEHGYAHMHEMTQDLVMHRSSAGPQLTEAVKLESSASHAVAPSSQGVPGPGMNPAPRSCSQQYHDEYGGVWWLAYSRAAPRGTG